MSEVSNYDWNMEYKGFHVPFTFFCLKTFSSIFNFPENIFSEAEFKELELRLKHGWFYLKLY